MERKIYLQSVAQVTNSAWTPISWHYESFDEDASYGPLHIKGVTELDLAI